MSCLAAAGAGARDRRGRAAAAHLSSLRGAALGGLRSQPLHVVAGPRGAAGARHAPASGCRPSARRPKALVASLTSAVATVGAAARCHGRASFFHIYGNLHACAWAGADQTRAPRCGCGRARWSTMRCPASTGRLPRGARPSRLSDGTRRRAAATGAGAPRATTCSRTTATCCPSCRRPVRRIGGAQR